MAYFKNKKQYESLPIPVTPPYIPPLVPSPDTPESGQDTVIDRPEYTSDTNIILYNITDDRCVMFKQLNNEYVMTGSIKTDIDIVQPIFEIYSEYDLTKYNYCYISLFERFYFVSIELVVGNKYRLTCICDPLMSFKEQLYTIPMIIEKEEQHNDLYINDGTYIQGAKNYTQVYNFSDGFNNTGTNILICCGGQ